MPGALWIIYKTLSSVEQLLIQNDSCVGESGRCWDTKPAINRDLQNLSATNLPSLAGELPDETASTAMQDALMLLFTVVFFGLAFLYVKACQKLR